MHQWHMRFAMSFPRSASRRWVGPLTGETLHQGKLLANPFVVRLAIVQTVLAFCKVVVADAPDSMNEQSPRLFDRTVTVRAARGGVTKELCSGVLLSESWGLTAGHCITSNW